ncbi:MAG TPA: bifunctional phosphopantothenoylcysteine decarboxylase/phosphopantothenate--cysteine ligase CoaBC [Gemmatimonadales bacterium]|nr:bifunctional phosphopantothenoylcysteine decarboxylase/phosphopantothenate--cysteine ligase CoaBC [Gemmatimonadales bacterium]
MSRIAGRHVVLGVSGGIAAYKSCIIARRLTEAGVAVEAVLTAAAAEFVGPVTFEALTGRPVVTSLWQPGRSLDHVRLGREADLVVVAPATAHVLARAAQGMADDFLTALLLACRAPLLLAPAMNDRMYAHPETQANLALLRSRGVHVLGPATGPLARGEGEGPGRMVEPEEVLAHAERLLRGAAPWTGARVLVTAGPTRERLDPVRVVTNRSSGRMGYALAREAWLRGADVTLISGPAGLEPPPGVDVVRVESTAELAASVGDALPLADLLLMAAAPADYRPAKALERKAKRSEGALRLDLEPTEDVLAGTTARRKKGAVVVGFALETDDVVASARAKLEAKRLDLVVANDATEPGAGPEVATNRVTIVSRDGAEALPLMAKDDVAAAILDRVQRLVSKRG